MTRFAGGSALSLHRTSWQYGAASVMAYGAVSSPSSITRSDLVGETRATRPGHRDRTWRSASDTKVFGAKANAASNGPSACKGSSVSPFPVTATKSASTVFISTELAYEADVTAQSMYVLKSVVVTSVSVRGCEDPSSPPTSRTIISPP